MSESLERLELRLLGAPQVYHAHSVVTGFITSKAEALFYYLAITARPHARSTLAALLWPDVAETVARKNLRDIIFNLRKLLGNHLTITRQTVALNFKSNPWIDVLAFRKLLEPQIEQCTYQELQSAIELYQGDLLDGFYVRETEAFDEWLMTEREQLRVAATHAMHQLVAYHLETASWNEGLQLTQRLLAMESWDEAAHRQQMRLLAASGQRGAALIQYERCCHILEQEFGVMPSAETQALYQTISTGDLPRHPKVPSATTIDALSINNGLRSKRDTPISQLLQRDSHAIPQSALFVGRDKELHLLNKAVLDKRQKLIAVVGLGGQGKTALVAHFVTQLFQRSISASANGVKDGRVPFHRLLWYSCQTSPSLADMLTYWLHQLSIPIPSSESVRTEQLLAALFDHLHHEPVLFILDNFENFLSADSRAGTYRRDFLEVEHLLERLVSSNHRGTLILTSREQPLTLIRLANHQVTDVLPIEGLTPPDAVQLLQQCQLIGTNEELTTLAARYSGNPLALKIVAETINELFLGNLQAFLQEEQTLFVDDIRHVLDQQFARLSPPEKDILLWLAIEREAVTPQQLWDNLIQPPTRNHFYEALRSLQRRFLLETDERSKRFTGQLAVHLSMQTVILEYVTEYFVIAISQELIAGTFDLFYRFLLVKAQAPDYVRQLQRRLLVQPLLRLLQAQWGKQWFEQRLQSLLSALKNQSEQVPGYAAANLLHLMLEAKIDLSTQDFSHLAIWQADLRRASLRYLNLAHADLKNSVFADHFGSVTAVAFSPDNRLLAAGTSDGNVHLWRMNDGQLAGICRGNGRWVWSLAFSPDGQLLTSGHADKVVRLWDISDIYTTAMPHLLTAILLKTFSGHEDAVFAVSFSPDGKLIASGSGDGTIRLWHVHEGTLLQTLAEHRSGILSLAFHPQQQDRCKTPTWLLASGGRDGVIYLWQIPFSITEPIESWRQLTHHRDEITSVSFCPDGSYLLSGSADHTVQFWSLAREKAERVFTDAADSILSVTCGNDMVAAAGNGGVIYLWHGHSDQLLLSLSGHTGAIGAIALTTDGYTLASGSFDQSLRIWDLRQGQSIRTHHSNRNEVQATALQPAERLFFSCSNDGTLVSWRLYPPHTAADNALIHAPLISLKPALLTNQQTGKIYALEFHPDEPYLICAGEDGFIHFWSVTDEIQCAEKFAGDVGTLLSLAISPDGEWLAAGSINAKVILCPFRHRRVSYLLATTTPLVEAVVFSPDGRYLFATSEEGTILIWELDHLTPDQSQVVTIDEPDYIVQTETHGALALAIHPAGHHLAIGGANPGVEVWQLPQLKLIHKYPTMSSTFAVAFSADGTMLAAGGGGNQIWIWNHDTGEGPQILEGHKGVVRRLHFTHNGMRLFSGGDDEQIIVWQQQETQWIRCERRRTPGPYEGLNIYGVTGINGEQQRTLLSLGAVEQIPVSPIQRQRHNLPTPLMPLYGRQEDMQRILDQLTHGESRLLAIVGEGGIGKTHVVLEVARTIIGLGHHPHFHRPQQQLFPDGIWFVNTAAIPAGARCIELLITSIGSVLSLSFDQHSSLADQLTNQLRERKLLLILDNFEHLRQYVTDFLSELLHKAAQIKIVITSRHHLEFFAQDVHRLQGLLTPDPAQIHDNETLLQYASVRLFVEQAKRVTGTFALSPANRAAVIWLCRFMNGLPLGIKLAAAQLVNYSLDEVVVRAQRDLSTLISSAADLPKHQHSLHALLQNSWEDLPTHLAKLLAYCTVFKDTFSDAAAKALADVSHNAVDELVHRCLLHAVGDGRYMIHEFVRTFIHTQPQNAPLLAAARCQHATYYAQLLDRIGRRKQSNVENFHLLSKEIANIRSAWQWIVEQPNLHLLQQGIEGFAYLHERLGQLTEAAHAIAAAITIVNNYLSSQNTNATEAAEGLATPAFAKEVLADLHIAYATLMEMGGDLDTTQHSAQCVIDYGNALAHPRLQAHGYYLMALQAQHRGQLKIAMEWAQQSAAVAIEYELVGLQITAQNLQGVLHDMQGNHSSAVTCYKAALPLAIESQDHFQERLLVNNLGIVALATGAWNDAKVYLERNLTLSEQAGNPTKHIYALMNHALLLNALGLYEQARKELFQGLVVARTTHHRQAEVYMLQFLSLTDFYGGRAHSGVKFAEEALTLIEEHQFTGLKAAVLAFLGHNYLALDQMERAHACYQESIKLWQAMGNRLEIGTVFIANAYSLLRLGRLAEALHYTEATLKMLDTILANNAMEAMWTIISCYFVLHEANDDRSYPILYRGYQWLIQQAEAIHDPEMRKAYLNNIYPHRLVIRAMRTHSTQQVEPVSINNVKAYTST